MAKINLLPWRAERREARKRDFFTKLGLAALVAVGLVLLWAFWMNVRISSQDNRNQYLTDQIKQLDAKITEIQNLQQVKDRLLARKRIVEKLQSSRSQMVHLFDQIVQTIPAGARITGLAQRGDQLTIVGVAQSNATVAQYMLRLQASPWMGPAHLVKTENVRADPNAPYEFQIVVTLGTPQEGEEGAPASASSTAAPSAVSSTPDAAAPTSEPEAAPASGPTAAAAPASAEPAPASTPDSSATKGGAKP